VIVPDQENAVQTPRRVVVAEDESLIRLDIVETLRDNGFEVVGEAGDGETAVALATELRPDLVIMDVKMPLLDGISAAERLTKNQIITLEAEVTDLVERFETRKLVDRAKGLLNEKMGLTEPEAFRWIQKASMDRRLTMHDVAQAIIEQLSAKK
jgi:AmiR/NasT family two-component response regulator